MNHNRKADSKSEGTNIKAKSTNSSNVRDPPKPQTMGSRPIETDKRGTTIASQMEINSSGFNIIDVTKAKPGPILGLLSRQQK